MAGDSPADVVARLRAAGCVFAEDEAALLLAASRSPGELATLLARREAGEPLEYVLGAVDFCGLRLAVVPGVFVPRQRTAFLVDNARALLPNGGTPLVVDLCCGCGAAGAALAARSQIELHAADIDPVAVDCAQGNVAPYGGHVYAGDLYAPLPAGLRGRVDVLMANAPYVPTAAIATMPPEAREHEPTVALDGGTDGLDVLRRVIADAPRWLAPRGHVIVESSRGQAPLVAEVMARVGLRAEVMRSDEVGGTVVIGTSIPVDARASSM